MLDSSVGWGICVKFSLFVYELPSISGREWLVFDRINGFKFRAFRVVAIVGLGLR